MRASAAIVDGVTGGVQAAAALVDVVTGDWTLCLPAGEVVASSRNAGVTPMSEREEPHRKKHDFSSLIDKSSDELGIIQKLLTRPNLLKYHVI